MGCDSFSHSIVSAFSVSIHAPRVGCDDPGAAGRFRLRGFNPRTPGGVRPLDGANRRLVLCFNPRTPGGVRHLCQQEVSLELCFNPRTPGGVRLFYANVQPLVVSFNPRTPGGVRPDTAPMPLTESKVSIHAPRVGCDASANSGCSCIQRFQSTHPGWGATGDGVTTIEGTKWFQSTHPGWGATRGASTPLMYPHVSIHAPRVGCDGCHPQRGERP